MDPDESGFMDVGLGFVDYQQWWFDLSYGGLNVTLNEIMFWPYDTMYLMIQKFLKQKAYEKKQAAKK